MSVFHARQWYHHIVYGRRMQVRHRWRHVRHRYGWGRSETGTHTADEMYHGVRSGLRTHHGLSRLRRDVHMWGTIYVSGWHYWSRWRMQRLMLWGQYRSHRYGGNGRMILWENRRTRYRVPYWLQLRFRHLMSSLCYFRRSRILPSGVMRRRWIRRTCRKIFLNVIRRNYYGDRILLCFMCLQIHDTGWRIRDNNMHLLRGLHVGCSFFLLLSGIRSRGRSGRSLCDTLCRWRCRLGADLLLTYDHFFIFVFTGIHDDVRVLANDDLLIGRGRGVMIVMISRVIRSLPCDLIDIQRKYCGRWSGSVVAKPSARQSLRRLIY